MFKNNFFIRLTNWEFWPTAVVYFPVFFYYLWLAIKARSLFFFSSANPDMETGGLFGTSKYRQLIRLPEDLRPVMILVSPGLSVSAIVDQLRSKGISFPCIAKPDKGERGVGVEILKNETDLENYCQRSRSEFLIQELITYSFEAGVFYYRYPDEEKGKICSIVLKEFLHVVGDGKSSIVELTKKNYRARLVWKALQVRIGEKINSIPHKGEKIILEPIGNHNRGTAFLNGNYLISENLENVFTGISNHIPDFYYGRFDLRAPSLEAFIEGKQIKILEVNGVNSEPAHIYDPSAKLLDGWKTLFAHWRIIDRISKINRKNGFKPITFHEAFYHYREWKKSKKTIKKLSGF